MFEPYQLHTFTHIDTNPSLLPFINEEKREEERKKNHSERDGKEKKPSVNKSRRELVIKWVVRILGSALLFFFVANAFRSLTHFTPSSRLKINKLLRLPSSSALPFPLLFPVNSQQLRDRVKAWLAFSAEVMGRLSA